MIEASHHQSLSRFMQWLLTSHVRRYHKHHGSSGHVWQGRFKSFPVQRAEHLLMVRRYVLRNPVRSGVAASRDIGPGQVAVGTSWPIPVLWKSRQTGWRMWTNRYQRANWVQFVSQSIVKDLLENQTGIRRLQVYLDLRVRCVHGPTRTKRDEEVY